MKSQLDCESTGLASAHKVCYKPVVYAIVIEIATLNRNMGR